MSLLSAHKDICRALAAAITPLPAEAVPLADCTGRVLAQDILSRDNVPSFDKSPLDGYALRSADTQTASRETPVTLRILEEIAAGSVPHCTLTPGTAVKILTGAPVPPGADVVVPYERTEFTPTDVTIFSPYPSGSNIVRIGEDIRKGQLLVAAGQSIDAGALASLAAQNIARPLVYRRPVVGILSTGNELADVGQELSPGQIYDSNGYSLIALLQGLGCLPRYYGHVRDNEEAIAAAFAKALEECDAVLSTGGVSVGDYDLVPAALDRIGAEIICRRADIKPGMACCYGLRNGKLICGLSGNPASSVANFTVIAMPVLRKLTGLRDYENREITVTLANDFPKASPGNRLIRGKLDLSDGTVKMIVAQGQGNVVISSFIGCDVEAIIPAGSGPLSAGTQLTGFCLSR